MDDVMSVNIKKLSFDSIVSDVVNDILKTGYNDHPIINENDQVVGIVT